MFDFSLESFAFLFIIILAALVFAEVLSEIRARPRPKDRQIREGHIKKGGLNPYPPTIPRPDPPKPQGVPTKVHGIDAIVYNAKDDPPPAPLHVIDKEKLRKVKTEHYLENNISAQQDERMKQTLEVNMRKEFKWKVAKHLKQKDEGYGVIHKMTGTFTKKDNCSRYALGKRKVACTDKRYFVDEVTHLRWKYVTCKRCLKKRPK